MSEIFLLGPMFVCMLYNKKATNIPNGHRNSFIWLPPNMINKVPTVSDITQVWQFSQIVFRSILVELLQNPAF